MNYKNAYEEMKRLYDKLQQENNQLKDKINTYEDPEDLTLMFMYCDEKAKDKIKGLKEVIEEVRERSKFERKTALSLNQHYAVSIIDSVLQILDKVKGNK